MTLNPEAWLAVPAEIGAAEERGAGPSRAEASIRARAKCRDEAALAALYAEHAPAVLRFLRDLLGCPATAADAVQETFARAFRRLDTLRDGDRIAPWLFGIARNVSLEMRKARRVRARYLAAASAGRAPGEEASHARTPEAELLGREAAAVVARALARLSEERRALLLLRLDHGLSYEEIAAAMGFSPAKVKVEIHRARLVLRDEMASYEGGGR